MKDKSCNLSLNNYSKNLKKAQEEMVGFVMIIVLVSVIALVFLAISLRKPSVTQGSGEIENFLRASLLYTTSCKIKGGLYDFKELISACEKREKCLDEEDACKILNETAFKLVEASFKIDSKYKAYIFKISIRNETIYELKNGNYTGNRIASEVPIYTAGDNLYVRLEVFY